MNFDLFSDLQAKHGSVCCPLCSADGITFNPLVANDSREAHCTIHGLIISDNNSLIEASFKRTISKSH